MQRSRIGAVLVGSVFVVAFIAAMYMTVSGLKAEMVRINEDQVKTLLRLEELSKQLEEEKENKDAKKVQARAAILTAADIEETKPELAAYNLVGEHEVVKLASYIEESGSISNGYAIAKAVVKIGRRSSIDPLMIAAIAEKESTFRVSAVSKSGKHRGLMQVDVRLHRKYINEVGGFKTPEQQIAVGVNVLSEYIEQYGTVKRALAVYSGGTPGYAADVEKRRRKIQRFLAKASLTS